MLLFSPLWFSAGREACRIPLIVTLSVCILGFVYQNVSQFDFDVFVRVCVRESQISVGISASLNPFLPGSLELTGDTNTSSSNAS